MRLVRGAVEGLATASLVRRDSCCLLPGGAAVTATITTTEILSEDMLNGDPKCEAQHIELPGEKSTGPCDGVASFHWFETCTGQHMLVCMSFVVQARGLPSRHFCGRPKAICYRFVPL